MTLHVMRDELDSLMRWRGGGWWWSWWWGSSGDGVMVDGSVIAVMVR